MIEKYMLIKFVTNTYVKITDGRISFVKDKSTATVFDNDFESVISQYEADLRHLWDNEFIGYERNEFTRGDSVGRSVAYSVGALNIINSLDDEDAFAEVSERELLSNIPDIDSKQDIIE
jgi:hypothetical protein